jgi:hypothetical protein
MPIHGTRGSIPCMCQQKYISLVQRGTNTHQRTWIRILEQNVALDMRELEKKASGQMMTMSSLVDAIEL